MMRTTRSGRKGVSPLIAAVLLIAFTMAVAAILTAWVTTFTQEQTGAVENQSDQVIECSGGVIDVLDSDSNGNQLNITVANVGTVGFDNLTVTVLSGGSVVGSNYINGLASGDTSFKQIDLSGAPDKVRVASRNCPSVSVTQNNP
jgi:flagellin-like protein